jgi:Flp pilus assembly protein TadG
MHFGTVIALISKFARCRLGNFASIFAVAAPVLLGLTGGAVDFMVYSQQQSEMQNAADAAVLAATREASLKSWSQTEAESVARSYVESELADAGLSSTALFNVTTEVDNVAHKVSITVDMDQHRYFLLGYFRKSPQIRVKAAAQLSSETPLCMIALNPAASKTLKITGSASLLADGCAAYSNSVAKDGLFVESTASLKSAFTCSAGGFGSGVSVFSPAPTSDCPPVPDPLDKRLQPVVGSCDYTGFQVAGKSVTISPGVYCGGLKVDKNAFVTMKPGVYIINGGELSTTNKASLTGDGVTIFFTGKDGSLQLDGTSVVSLKAPATGPTAGMLMFQDRAMAQTVYEISSKVAAQLLGTIYLPNGHLKVMAPGKVADQSAFTVIVVRSIEVGANTRIYLNSNYGATNVPVPFGLGPSKTVNLVN